MDSHNVVVAVAVAMATIAAVDNATKDDEDNKKTRSMLMINTENDQESTVPPMTTASVH